MASTFPTGYEPKNDDEKDLIEALEVIKEASADRIVRSDIDILATANVSALKAPEAKKYLKYLQKAMLKVLEVLDEHAERMRVAEAENEILKETLKEVEEERERQNRPEARGNPPDPTPRQSIPPKPPSPRGTGGYKQRIKQTEVKTLKLPKLEEDNWLEWRINVQATMETVDMWQYVAGQENTQMINNDPVFIKDRERVFMVLARAMPKKHVTDVMETQGNPVKLFSRLERIYAPRRESSRVNTRNEWETCIQNDKETFTEFFQRWNASLAKHNASGGHVTNEEQVKQLIKSIHRRYSLDVRMIRNSKPAGEYITIEDLRDRLLDADNWNGAQIDWEKEKLRRRYQQRDQRRDRAFSMAAPRKREKHTYRGQRTNFTTSKEQLPRNTDGSIDYKRVKCYNCQKHGHFATSCNEIGSATTRKRPFNDTNKSQFDRSQGPTRVNKLPLKPYQERGNQAETQGFSAMVLHPDEYDGDESDTTIIDEDHNTHVETCAPAMLPHINMTRKAGGRRIRQRRAIVDSGCTRHMSNNRHHFKDFVAFKKPRYVMLANDFKIKALGMGTITTREHTVHGINELEWDKTLYVPELTNPLFSCAQIIRQGYDVLLTLTGAILINRTYRAQRVHYAMLHDDDSLEMTWHFVQQTESTHPRAALTTTNTPQENTVPEYSDNELNTADMSQTTDTDNSDSPTATA